MKIVYLMPLMLLVGLTACGQTGPLYLPKNAPKVYDEPAPDPNEANKEKTTKPAPPPMPDSSTPTTEPK
jgi:predicted small lipoprotein YifL